MGNQGRERAEVRMDVSTSQLLEAKSRSEKVCRLAHRYVKEIDPTVFAARLGTKQNAISSSKARKTRFTGGDVPTERLGTWLGTSSRVFTGVFGND